MIAMICLRVRCFIVLALWFAVFGVDQMKQAQMMNVPTNAATVKAIRSIWSCMCLPLVSAAQPLRGVSYLGARFG